MKTYVISILSALALTGAAAAQPTSFTYQGRLKNGAQPASGLHDFRFRLFDAASAGNQVGTVQCADNVPVTGGLFTVPIDFGQQYNTSAPRFLEIEVRADTGLGCGSAGGFVTLGPRQPVTGAPIAVHAHAAFALDAPDGSPANAVFVNNDGRVGIGTTNPGSRLDVQGSDSSNILFGRRTGGGLAHNMFIDGNGNGSMQFLDGAGVPRINLGAQDSTYFTYGNVGIGTTTPTARLHVVGDAVVGGPLTATSLNISTTTRSWTLHPYGLMETTPGTGGVWTINDAGLTVVGVGNEFAGSVQLPDGATIIALEVLGHDGSTATGADVIATLGRTNFAGGTLAMATVSSTLGGSVWQTTSITFPTVDNDTHSYWVRVTLHGGVAPPFDVTLRAIRIIYRITQPLP